jgi:hypothetical protein
MIISRHDVRRVHLTRDRLLVSAITCEFYYQSVVSLVPKTQEGKCEIIKKSANRNYIILISCNSLNGEVDSSDFIASNDRMNNK